jgi:hypothetical protein
MTRHLSGQWLDLNLGLTTSPANPINIHRELKGRKKVCVINKSMEPERTWNTSQHSILHQVICTLSLTQDLHAGIDIA